MKGAIMKSVKDLLYNTSDILVAILILCCAVVVITMRVDAIMTYPEKMVSEQVAQGGHLRPDWPGPAANYDDPDSDSADDGETDNTEPEDDVASGEPGDGAVDQPENSESVTHSLYIAYAQPMNEIADNLVKLGFFENRQDFFNILESQNASQKVQAGNFLLPGGSTKEDIIKIITSPAN